MIGKAIPKNKLKLRETFITNTGIFLIYPQSLIKINSLTGILQTINLPSPVHSPPLLVDDCLYYGSKDKYLLKFSLITKQTIWKRRIPLNFSLRPTIFKNHLVIVLSDNNIYFFSLHGILKWSKNLDKTILYPPIKLNDSIAVITFPKRSPFINIFNLDDRNKLSYQTNRRIFNPVYFQNRILFYSEDEIGSLTQIHSISNSYSVYIKLDPEELIPVNQAIEINLKPVNLIDPSYKVTIIAQDKNLVFTKNITPWESNSFQFIPKNPGRYTIELSVSSENRKTFLLKNNFVVHDLSDILNSYYYKLQINCPTDLID
jgi:hypothetical protein